MSEQHVVVIDEGTTSTRAVLFDAKSRVVAESSRHLSIQTPTPQQVEQDAQEMLDRTVEALRDVLSEAEAAGHQIAVLGLSNQRTTTVLWDKHSGKPVAPIVSWQDTRAQERVNAMREEWGACFNEATGLQLQAANSAMHLAELLDDPQLRIKAEEGLLLAGTPDTWLIWSLTGGPKGGKHVTSQSNAGSTGAFDLASGSWWGEFLDELDVPVGLLPEVLDDDGDFGVTSAALVGRELPIRSAFADQQAALFGHGGFEAGAAKCTHGTGSFVDFNVGSEAKAVRGVDLRIAWVAGGESRYMFEGSSFVTGSAIDWLVDSLGVLSSANELDAVCAATPDAHGAICIPALAGFTAPYWDQSSTGSVFGLTRGVTKNHLVRATVDGIAATIADLVRFMAAEGGTEPGRILVDGGLSRSDALLQAQADFTGATVTRAADAEHVTARGAAWMAGVSVGVWKSKEHAAEHVKNEGDFLARRDAEQLSDFRNSWEDAIQRTLGWHGWAQGEDNK